jgi:hypothetical protein
LRDYIEGGLTKKKDSNITKKADKVKSNLTRLELVVSVVCEVERFQVESVAIWRGGDGSGFQIRPLKPNDGLIEKGLHEKMSSNEEFLSIRAMQVSREPIRPPFRKRAGKMRNGHLYRVTSEGCTNEVSRGNLEQNCE